MLNVQIKFLIIEHVLDKCVITVYCCHWLCMVSNVLQQIG